MSSTVAVFLKGWQLKKDLEQYLRPAAASDGAPPISSWYWIIAGGKDEMKQMMMERSRAQSLQVIEGRVFVPTELQGVVGEPEHARALADYLWENLWRIVRPEHEKLLVQWRGDWPALAIGASSLMGLVDVISWWHPSERFPRLGLPEAVRLGAALRRRDSGSALERIIGKSPLMEQLRQLLRARARLPYPVLLIGETGSGKELAARALHEESGRPGRFVSINAALLGPDRMAESELFGHAKGAFTGATRARQGRIREADQGTFFLDELDSLPQETQARLLRALANVKEARIDVTPVGAEDGEPHKVSARFIAALQRNPLELDDFRRDLYFRIATIPIEIPPLRRRGEDVLELAAAELARLGQGVGDGEPFRLADNAAKVFLEYRWPGNVRELQRVVLLGYLAARDAGRREIQAEDVKPHLIATETPTFDGQGPLEIQVAEYQLAAARYALARHPGNKTAAARELGYETGQALDRMMEAAQKKLKKRSSRGRD